MIDRRTLFAGAASLGALAMLPGKAFAAIAGGSRVPGRMIWSREIRENKWQAGIGVWYTYSLDAKFGGLSP